MVLSDFGLKFLAGGFFSGTFAGAAWGYFAGKISILKQQKQDFETKERDFLNISFQMPKLISAIKKDLSAEKQQHIREFLVLPHQKVYHQMPLHWRFVYFENEFADLKVKLNILLNMDYIEKVSAERTPIYRMKEDFVELIKRCGSQVRIG